MYEITKNTIALISDSSNYYQTKVIEASQQSNPYANETIKQILEHNCIENGSSLVGRSEYSESILLSNHNLPIAVLPEKGIFFFPTSSIHKPGGALLSYYHIVSFQAEGKLTAVKLSNNQRLYLNITHRQFDRQMKRTSQVIAHYYRKDYLS